MSTAWLSLGANLDNPVIQLVKATTLLAAHEKIEITAKSRVLKNPAWGKTDQPDFHNIALEIYTDLLPLELLEACQAIETRMGRIREEKWGPRLIDIDIVAFNRFKLKSKRLTLPHIHAHEREFVMNPLREISPETADWIHKLTSG